MGLNVLSQPTGAGVTGNRRPPALGGVLFWKEPLPDEMNGHQCDESDHGKD